MSEIKFKNLCTIQENDEGVKSSVKVEDLICLLCKDIVQSTPVKCNQCQGLYCKDCAEMLKNKKKNCLMRNSETNIEKSKEHLLLGYFHDGNLENVLNTRVLFKCWGCNFSTKNISEISYHILYCDSMTIPKSCPNRNCDFKGSDLEVEKHQLKCKFFMIKCGVCGLKLKSLEEQQKHNCMNKIVEDLTLMEETIISEEKRLENYVRERREHLESLAKKYNISLIFCKTCKASLKWISNDNKFFDEGYYTCNSINNGCNKNFRFYCETCRIVFCTNCVKFEALKLCYCGKELINTNSLLGHKCDLCRNSVNNAWRCSDCDFDLCTSCFPSSSSF